MTPDSFSIAAYTLASILFILSLRGLSTQETAQRGNTLGVVGMLLAIIVTSAILYQKSMFSMASIGLTGGSIVIGAVIGAMLAARVAMTAMPELVAVLHSFVGLAAVLVGIASMMESRVTGIGDHGVAHEVEVFIGVLVGAITFTGSIIAFFKLRGTLDGKPTLLPGRHMLNAVALISCVSLTALGIMTPGADGMIYLYIVTVISGLLGVHLVIAIGGGDMPVVVSLLNSYSGWAASAAGFMLNNDLLIITGALVGSSGAILSFIMCKAMNRSIWNVVFGGFGATPTGTGKAKVTDPNQKVQSTSAEEVAGLLMSAKSAMIVPGYGLAVAQAQHVVKEITSVLATKGVKVQYAIHPVAGRLPGHMNVLLAEAGVSYEIVKEMEEIEHEFKEIDVVVVIGANDIVNPSALDDPESPIYGMPVLEVWKSAKVVMLKRGMAAGYAGVDNPLCYRENTLMLFGDAKQSVSKLLNAIQNAS